MGGGSAPAQPQFFGGSGQPYDLMGGQYATFSGGTPSGVNWPGVAQDAGGALQAFAKNSGPLPTPGLQQTAGVSPMQQQQMGLPTSIPQSSYGSGMGSGDIQQIMSILQSILGSGSGY